jgi:hypothetical protein
MRSLATRQTYHCIVPRMSQRLGSYDDLVAFLVAQKIPHEADPANHAVQIATSAPALPGTAFVRWETSIPFLTIMQQMSGEVPEGRVREVETALCHVNDVAMIPGYGYTYQGKVIYYRFAVPLFGGEITSDDLDRALTVVLNNAVQLEPAFKKVLEGGDGAGVLGYLAKRN